MKHLNGRHITRGGGEYPYEKNVKEEVVNDTMLKITTTEIIFKLRDKKKYQKN